jgi:hypothetical protein
MLNRVIVVTLCATPLLAQTTMLGAMVRGGAFSASSSDGAAGGAQMGVEACLLCAGRIGLFAEYSHWFSIDRGIGDRVSSADLAAAGLRIQSRRPTSVFFDIGLAGGRDWHSSGQHGGIGGIVAGGGVRIPITPQWMLRPQVRLYGMSPHSIEGV